jgi:hypothetical protein
VSIVASDASAATTLRQMIMGFRVTQLLHVAAALRIADHLEPEPRTAADLAKATEAEPSALARVLRALTAIGLLVEQGDHTYALTALGRLLRTDVSGSLHALALLYGDEWLWRPYGQMLHSVLTGRPAFDHVHGESIYDYQRHHPDATAVFQAAMSAYSAQESGAIGAAYDFSDAAAVVDVGGGHGALVKSLLERYPRLRGVVFDLEEPVASARTMLADAGFADRSDCIDGSFFVSVPAGGDVYALKSILHNWDDGAAASILRNCRRAMRDGARLLIIERVIPADPSTSEAALFDINMLVVTSGRERTATEYEKLLEAAGLRLTRVIPTQSALSLIEARLPLAAGVA